VIRGPVPFLLHLVGTRETEVELMTGARTTRCSFLFAFHCVVLGATAGLLLPADACAVVAIFDGFGDADVNNNGIPLEMADADVSGAGDSAIGPYIALGNGGTPMLYPMDTMVNEVTTVEDASDVGIRWFSISPFTGAPSLDPRVAVHVIDDSAGALPETNPSIGYFHSVPGQTRFATAIDNGLALAAEAKGRSNQFAGFFNDTIELGQEVGDEVKVSFDFRVWFSAANFNDATFINHVPAIGELRFGVYQDTDSQLGQSNSVAGPGNTPAVWGQAHGNFRGDPVGIGAHGDHGWFARIPIDDVDNESINKPAGGAAARIVEEVNTGTGTNARIMNGTTDSVAQPDQFDPQFVNLDLNRVYNIALALERYDDPATEGDMGDTIFATITVTDRATQQQWSFGNYERVIHPTTTLPDGISSDSWDYFVMGLAGETDSDDFDWIIDNFMVEVLGSNAGIDGDYNGDGKVDAADYVVWRKDPTSFGGTPGGYDTWRQNFGAGSPGSGSGPSPAGQVPEPVSLVLLLGLSSSLLADRRLFSGRVRLM
jgi:hypothetical protein